MNAADTAGQNARLEAAFVALCSLHCMHCIGWKPRFTWPCSAVYRDCWL